MDNLGSETITILLVEDDESFAKKVFHVFEKTSEITCAKNLSEARHLLNQKAFDICLLDYTLPDGFGTELLSELANVPDRGPIIFLSANSDPEVKKLCFILGVDDFIEKDSDFQTNLFIRIPKAIQTNRNSKKNQALSSLYNASFRNEIIGSSDAIDEVRKKLDILRGESINSLLVQGPAGSGKELAVSYFNADIRSPRTIIRVDCNDITHASFESEFYGVKKATFNQELAEKPGYFELASEGDLLLKNIDRLSRENQRKLLRFLSSREYLPLHSNYPKRSNARVIATTRVDLQENIYEGKFLKALYQRLSLHTVTIPSLEARIADIPYLIRYFLATQKESSMDISKQALSILGETDWPENVRELFDALRDAYLNAKSRGSQKIEVRDFKKKHLSTNIKLLLPRYERDVNRKTLETYLQKAEEIYWKEAFRIFNGNASRLARESDIPLSTINNKIKDFNLRSC